MIKLIIAIIFCHLVGDYVLQSDFIANTKGKNWYHLFVHCALYCLPFYIVFGFNEKVVYLLITHIVIDSLKARFGKIDYIQDQTLHYAIALTLYLF